MSLPEKKVKKVIAVFSWVGWSNRIIEDEDGNFWLEECRSKEFDPKNVNIRIKYKSKQEMERALNNMRSVLGDDSIEVSQK